MTQPTNQGPQGEADNGSQGQSQNQAPNTEAVKNALRTINDPNARNVVLGLLNNQRNYMLVSKRWRPKQKSSGSTTTR